MSDIRFILLPMPRRFESQKVPVMLCLSLSSDGHVGYEMDTFFLGEKKRHFILTGLLHPREGSKRNRGERTWKKDVRKTGAKLEAKKTNGGLIKRGKMKRDIKRDLEMSCGRSADTKSLW